MTRPKDTPWKPLPDSSDRDPQFITACKMHSQLPSSLLPRHSLHMYSTILSDGRLRDLVNGHASAAPPLHSDASWSATAGALFDGSLGFGGGVSRGSTGVLGAEGTRNAFDNLASASVASAAASKETVDIRHILSNPLPPLLSDVEFVRSEASFAATGALFAPFLSQL